MLRRQLQFIREGRDLLGALGLLDKATLLLLLLILLYLIFTSLISDLILRFSSTLFGFGLLFF